MNHTSLPTALGYLDRIADKVLEREPSLTPRLPSIFEPMTSLGTSPDVASALPDIAIADEVESKEPSLRRQSLTPSINRAESEHNEEALLSQSTRGKPPGKKRHFTTEDDPEIPPHELRVRIPTASTKPYVLYGHEPLVSSPQPDQGPAEHVRPNIAARPIAALTSISKLELRTGDKPQEKMPFTMRIQSTDSALDPPRRDQVQTALPSASGGNDEAIVASPHSVESLPSPRPLALPLSSREIQVIASLVAPRDMPRRPAQDELPQNNELPVVHVTIGRIELRATERSTPRNSAPSASGRKPMGLDEYLKQRGGEH